jgi:uncharacterized protein
MPRSSQPFATVKTEGLLLPPELFYAGKLWSPRRPRPADHQGAQPGPLSGAGLRYLPVEHSGNRNSSPEEAQAIKDLVTRTLESGARWIDRDGNEHPCAWRTS